MCKQDLETCYHKIYKKTAPAPQTTSQCLCVSCDNLPHTFLINLLPFFNSIFIPFNLLFYNLGLHELVRKGQLSKLLAQMQQLFPEEYEFYPKTWLLPEQYHEFCLDLAEMRGEDNNPTFIVKPDGGSQGEGIYLINDPAQLTSIGMIRPAIVQEYVSKPLLLERTKFDLRVYVLLASIEPLQIYISKEGMARFCTLKYQEPTTQNLQQVYMHLTNYSLNKNSENYVHTYTADKGSKRTMSATFMSLGSRGHDTLQLWEDIEELVVKTMTAILPDLKVTLLAENPSNRPGPTCFQVNYNWCNKVKYYTLRTFSGYQLSNLMVYVLMLKSCHVGVLLALELCLNLILLTEIVLKVLKLTMIDDCKRYDIKNRQ